MPESNKSKCTDCGAEILAATAERTDGLCMPCTRRQSRLTPEQAEKELELAAAALETRAKLLRIETKLVPPAQWEAPLLQIVPEWYRRLLARFSLSGVGLEYRDKTETFVRVFSFAGPDDLDSPLAEESDGASLAAAGFLILGYESDGNYWVIRRPFAASSAVYLLDHSAWDGGLPTERNGLVFASSRLSLLLCSMAISSLSYDQGVTSLLWYEDGP